MMGLSTSEFIFARICPGSSGVDFSISRRMSWRKRDRSPSGAIAIRRQGSGSE